MQTHWLLRLRLQCLLPWWYLHHKRSRTWIDFTRFLFMLNNVYIDLLREWSASALVIWCAPFEVKILPTCTVWTFIRVHLYRTLFSTTRPCNVPCFLTKWTDNFFESANGLGMGSSTLIAFVANRMISCDIWISSSFSELSELTCELSLASVDP